MPYRAIATDYDGTLATDGLVDANTWAAVDDWRQQDGQILLVTGRQLAELQRVCPHWERFAAIVAENGTVVHWPAEGRTHLLSAPPPPIFVERLQAMGVTDIQRGQVVVATWQPHDTTVQHLLNELQLDFQVILNKRAVMVLPSGMDKATGLKTALAALKVPAHEVAAIGDAENDIPLLQSCGLGVAVANALPEVQAIADYTTQGERGAGVQELIRHLLAEATGR